MRDIPYTLLKWNVKQKKNLLFLPTQHTRISSHYRRNVFLLCEIHCSLRTITVYKDEKIRKKRLDQQVSWFGLVNSEFLRNLKRQEPLPECSGVFNWANATALPDNYTDEEWHSQIMKMVMPFVIHVQVWDAISKLGL